MERTSCWKVSEKWSRVTWVRYLHSAGQEGRMPLVRESAGTSTSYTWRIKGLLPGKIGISILVWRNVLMIAYVTKRKDLLRVQIFGHVWDSGVLDNLTGIFPFEIMVLPSTVLQRNEFFFRGTSSPKIESFVIALGWPLRLQEHSCQIQPLLNIKWTRTLNVKYTPKYAFSNQKYQILVDKSIYYQRGCECLTDMRKIGHNRGILNRLSL